MLVEKYINACATRAVANKDGEYSFKVLLTMHLCHLPRQQEIIRTLYKALEDLANSDIDIDEGSDVQIALDAALSSIIKCEEIAADGLQVMGYNIGLEEDDGN